MFLARFSPCFTGLISLGLTVLLAPLAVADQAVVDEPHAHIYNEMPGEVDPAVYIIQLVDPPLAVYDGGLPGLAATAPRALGARKLDLDSPASRAYEAFLADRQSALLSRMSSLLGRSLDLRFSYRHAYNGLAVVLSPAEAARVARLDGVSLLYRESEDELLTDAGPALIGAPSVWGAGDQWRVFTSTIDGGQEVPPSGSAATGHASLSFDLATSTLNWQISHSVANPTAAHLHAGAAGTNGPIEVTLDHTVNPMQGSATLTTAQRNLLMNSNLYINIHSAAFPAGEIRGQVLTSGSRGEGIIVGIIDSGINSGHPSFAAVSGDGYAHSNPFGSGNYVGYCVANPGFCNDKLIGAWALHPSSTNPEDINGHGTHVAGTAVGNWLPSPTLVAPTASYTFESVSGVAPRANLIAYEVCVPSCPTSSTTAAVNQALIDGVDILNYSISGGSNPYVETTAVAFRNAAMAGVFPANSAGNSGPGASTVGHQGPWIMTVAASIHDRAILNSVVDLNGSAGSHPPILGQSPAAGFGPAPLVYAGNAPYNNPLCNPFPPGTFSGQIVVCDRGVIGRVAKGQNVLYAGGGGMILLNDAPSAASLNDDPHVLPATHVSHADGVSLKAWMASGSGHTGRITGGSVDYAPSYADNMASFSSRGPAGQVVAGLGNLIKPDISAPGLNILAAYIDGASPPPVFTIISGTSMSSPHAAGAAALLRSLQPSWTTAELKSALMMTGVTAMTKEDGMTSADPFDRGSGRIELNRANKVGFVLDISESDYVSADPGAGGDPRLLNLPSMATLDCPGLCSWTRTLRSVLDADQVFEAWVTSGQGVVGTVTPNAFTLPAGGVQEIVIEVNSAAVDVGNWGFAELHIEAIPDSPPPPAANDFEGHFAIANWTLSNTPGDVAGSFSTQPGPPIELLLVGGNSGTGGSTDFSIEIPFDGRISFDWGYQSSDTGQWDSGGFVLNGHYSVLAYNDTQVPFHEGARSVWVSAGDHFGFRVFTEDGSFGAGNLGVSHFRFEPEPEVAKAIMPIAARASAPLPAIEFNATGLQSTQLAGMVRTRSLTISNAGPGSLDWSISAPAGQCNAPGDVPWLSVAPLSGSLAYQAQDEVSFEFDSAGLGLGVYIATICVESNDPDTPLVELPIQLRVVNDPLFADRFQN